MMGKLNCKGVLINKSLGPKYSCFLSRSKISHYRYNCTIHIVLNPKPQSQRVSSRIRVTLEGAYFKAHADEILRIVNHHAEYQRAEHPLKRVMHLETAADSAVITTTDIHLARGIAEAVHHACQGELELQYNPGENQLRAYWQR